MSPAEYKAEYEHYLQHRIESELACQQLALCIPQLQNRATLEPPSPSPYFKTRLGVLAVPELRPCASSGCA